MAEDDPRRSLHEIPCFLLVIALLILTAPAAVGQPFNVGMFRPWSGYAIPNGVWLTGDFNGDGKTDIFHAVADTDVANVWFSFGDGSFSVQPFRPWDGYAIPNGVWLTGDFDGDKKTDIFHAVADTDVANVWFSKGDGTFRVQTFRPWSGYAIPNGVWLTGDFNGDGKTDVFHAVAGTDVTHIWFSNGDGTFNVQTFRPWDGYAIPNGVWLTGDFNKDGKTDIFHAVSDTDVANIWMSNWLPDGSGRFDVRAFRPWEGYAIPNGLWMTGDFDGDGRTDVFHAVENADVAHVWLSKGDSTFDVKTFRPWSGYAIPNGVWVTGDWNGDGATDVLHAVADTNYANLWLSNRDGTFAVQAFSPWGGYAIPNGLWLPADVTGDGKVDVVHAVASGDYVHPWMSVLPNPLEAFARGLEVTQAIQSLAEDVPLIAGKPTIVRAYFDAPSSARSITVQGNLAARNVTTNVVTNIASVVPVTLNASQNGQLQLKRNSLSLSLNFVLPAALTAAGTFEFTVTSVVIATTGQNVPCSNCAAGRVSASFQTSSPLRIRMVGLRYNTGIPPATVVNQPAAADFNLLTSWLGRAYPVPSVISTRTTILSNNGWPFPCGLANAQLQAMRATEVGTGTDPRTHYLGLVSNRNPGMRGCSSGRPESADPTVVASGPVGNPAGPGALPINVTGDTDASFADWYGGHELAHTFGRSHPGFCNGNSSDDSSFPNPNGQISDNANTYVGWDAGDAANGVAPAALAGTTTLDIMTYCNQPQWLSAYTYEAIRDRLNAENPTAGGAGGTSGSGSAQAPLRDTFTTASGIEFTRGCLCPRVKPALQKAPEVITAYRAPVKITTGRDIAPRIPKPSGQKLPLPDPAFRELYAEPAAKKPAAVETFITARAAVAEPTKGAMQVELKEGRYVSLVASINLTRITGKLLYVNHVSRAMVPTHVPSPRVVLRFTGRTGQILGLIPQELREDSDREPQEDRTALVVAVVPEMPNVATVELLIGNTVVDRIDVPAKPPVVSDIGVSYGDARGDRTLHWSARSVGKAPLLYLVQLSPDGKTQWETTAVGSPSSELVLSSEEARRYAGWIVRVIANDGYNDSAPVVHQLGMQ